jgi:hypothetical protein
MLIMRPRRSLKCFKRGFGTHFTCFTGTKVRVLSLPAYWYKSKNALKCLKRGFGTHFTCFTGTQVRILTLSVCRKDNSETRLIGDDAPKVCVCVCVCVCVRVRVCVCVCV